MRRQKAEGVPTVYIQHACVTERFPPLVVDYALLDGVDAREKYLSVGRTNTHIKLIGPTRLDGYQMNINRKHSSDVLGVCFSLADEEPKIFELLEWLKSCQDLKIVVRPHYAMNKNTRDRIVEFAMKHNFNFSEHKKTPAIEFLRSIDLMICGVSSIALEAAMMNISVINFRLNTTEIDWYGFIKNGLMDSTDRFDELETFVDSNRKCRVGNRTSAKRYSATINTAFDGRSAELAATELRNIDSSLYHQHEQPKEKR